MFLCRQTIFFKRLYDQCLFLLIHGQNSHPAGSLKISLKVVTSQGICFVLVGHGVSNTIMVNEMYVPYMTTKWKNAIGGKWKAEAKYRQNKTPENCEHKWKCRNEAKKIGNQRTLEDKIEYLRRNPQDFFRTFKPFLGNRGIKCNSDIELNIEGDIIKDQIKITETLADHFATIADGIGGAGAELWNLNDFTDHPSAQLIKEKSRGSKTFDFQEINPAQLKRVLESLNVNKATGHDGIPAKILKAGADEISQPLPRDWKKGDWTPVYKYRLRHRKCDVQIFIHELQNFGKRMSECSERVSFPKFCNG